MFNEEEVADYVGRLRSQLSPYELSLIFYNAVSYPTMEYYLTKLCMFNNLRINLLAEPHDSRIFHPKAFGKDKFIEFSYAIKYHQKQDSDSYVAFLEILDLDDYAELEKLWEKEKDEDIPNPHTIKRQYLTEDSE